MLIKALVDHAQLSDATPSGYAEKTLGFVLGIDQDLGGCTLLSRYRLETNAKGKTVQVATKDVIPNLQRSGTAPRPFLGCDTAAYVMGRPKTDPDPDKQLREDGKAAAKQRAFDELLAAYAVETGDIIARDFLRWRDEGSPGLAEAVERLSEFELKRLDLDPVAIRVGDSGLLHSSEDAASFWSRRAMESKSGGEKRICLSCGQLGPVVSTIPQSLSGTLIPGTSTASIALSSANFPAASRGASGLGLKSAPICAGCASAAVTAFNTLAADRQHRWGDRGDDTATIWWSTDTDFSPSALDLPEPGAIAKLMQSLDGRSGQTRVRDRVAARFYALTFSGNVARLVIRHWIDIGLSTARENLADWFRDTAGPRTDHEYPSLTDLAKSCGPLIRRDGRWVESPPEGARDALLRTALSGTPPPRGLLVRAVARTSAEIHYAQNNDSITRGIVRRRADSRFGLIRLVLNRSSRKENPVSQYLDESEADPAYLSGRLFAVRERLQYLSSGGTVNSTIVDRYFERASANPASVEHALAVLEKQHLKTLRRKIGEGLFVSFSKQLGRLHDVRGAAPSRLTVDQQAMWIAGYHQQVQHDFRESAARPAGDDTKTKEKK